MKENITITILLLKFKRKVIKPTNKAARLIANKNN